PRGSTSDPCHAARTPIARWLADRPAHSGFQQSFGPCCCARAPLPPSVLCLTGLLSLDSITGIEKISMSFAAPFVSYPHKVEDQWIDYNGHFNMAYYNIIF